MVDKNFKIKIKVVKFPVFPDNEFGEIEYAGRGRPRRPLQNIDGLPALWCPKCRKSKTLDQFYRRKGTKKYYSSYCKKCYSKVVLARYRPHL